jgi:hypothetical protein
MITLEEILEVIKDFKESVIFDGKTVMVYNDYYE